MEWQRDEFVVTTDQSRFDLDVIHRFLAQESYWARGIPRATMERSIANSLCFAVLQEGRPVGFVRVVSDFATSATLGDVFILDDYRGRGLAKWLLACVHAHPDLQGLRRWVLATADAHGLYRQFGFTKLKHPERFMELLDPDVYAAVNAQP